MEFPKRPEIKSNKCINYERRTENIPINHGGLMIKDPHKPYKLSHNSHLLSIFN